MYDRFNTGNQTIFLSWINRFFSSVYSKTPVLFYSFDF